METVRITNIENNIPGLKVMVCPPNGTPIIIHPPSRVGFPEVTLPFIETEEEINCNTIFAFKVEGSDQEFAFAAIKHRGIVSALGRTGADFFPDETSLARESFGELEAGNPVTCKFEIRPLESGSYAIWVLGALDELPQKDAFTLPSNLAESIV